MLGGMLMKDINTKKIRPTFDEQFGIPWCNENCPSYVTVDADWDGVAGYYKNIQSGCEVHKDFGPYFPEYCEECCVCLPAITLGLKPQQP